MAWNEPGKGQSPWGDNNGGPNKGGGNGGPPDLDEIWNRLRQRFAGKGGSGQSGGGSGGGNFSGGIGKGSIGLIVAVVVAIWLLSGFYVVDAGERGVVLQFGAYKTSSNPGPHWHLPYPIQTVEKVDIQKVRSARDSAVMLTKDENIVDVKVTAQYRVNDAGAYLFNIREPDQTVQETLKSAVREVVGTSRMNEVIQRGAEEVALEKEILGKQVINADDATPDSNNVIAADDEGDTVTQPEDEPQTVPAEDEKVVERIRKEQSAYPQIEKRSRADLPLNITKILQYNLDSYKSGLTVTAVNVQYAQPPEAVQSAFEAAIKAREEQQRLKNEARAYAQDVINSAQGEADALVNQAEGYRARVVQRSEGDASRFTQLLTEYERAPDVTRKRLYLDTMQSVLESSTKVLVDSKSGNQLMYLPLDKIIQNSGKNSSKNRDKSSDAGSSSRSGSGGSTPTPIDPLRSRSR